MSTIARQIAGASLEERLAEFQRVEPNLRRQFKEHLEKEGRAADFDKEFPAILEQAKQRALTSPIFGQQASRHAANCQCESHAPAAPRPLGSTAHRIAGPEPIAEVDKSKVTEKELSVALESTVKPKFVQWCAEEKVADAEAEWKAKLPKLTEDFKASKHFGRSILAVRESLRRCNESLEHVKLAFDKWASQEGLSPEQAAQKWESDVKPKAEAKIAEKESSRPARPEGAGKASFGIDRASVRANGERMTAYNAEQRALRQDIPPKSKDEGPYAEPMRRIPPHLHGTSPHSSMGGWYDPTPSREIGKGERKGRPGPGARTPSPYGVNKKERKGLKQAAAEVSRMEGKPSAKALIDQVLEG